MQMQKGKKVVRELEIWTHEKNEKDIPGRYRNVVTENQGGADEDGGRVRRVVFNQNVFQLILQLRHCSLALAHTRDGATVIRMSLI